MSDEELKNKLDAYFGFARKKKSLFVGMQLDEMLSRRKIALVVLLKECSLKNEDHYRRYQDGDRDLHIIRYDGRYDIKSALGYELLNAVGIRDDNLAKAILDTLKNDMTGGKENE